MKKIKRIFLKNSDPLRFINLATKIKLLHNKTQRKQNQGTIINLEKLLVISQKNSIFLKKGNTLKKNYQKPHIINENIKWELKNREECSASIIREMQIQTMLKYCLSTSILKLNQELRNELFVTTLGVAID